MAGPIDSRLISRAAATRNFLVAVALVGCAQAVLVIGQARVLSSAVAGVFDSHRLDGVARAALLVAGIFAVRGALTWLSGWLAHRASAAVKSQLRTEVMAARLDSPAATRTPIGTLITLMTTGLDALDGYYGKYLPQLLMASTVPFIIGAVVLWQDRPSALILAVTLPLIPLFMVLIGLATRDQVNRRLAVQNRLANHFADLVAGLATLQVFGRARAQLAGLRSTEEANRSETMKTLRITFMSSFALELLSTLSVALVAVTVGFRVVFGHLDLETALFVLILAPEVYLPVRQVGVHFHDSAEGQAAAEEALAIIEAAGGPGQQDRVAAPDLAARELVLDEVAYSYPGASRPALSGLDLVVHPGQIVALVGPSGSGKSTALALVMGFLRADSGQLRVGAVPLDRLDPQQWRAQLAWVGQEPGMVRGTIADNVLLGDPQADAAAVRRVLDEVGAEDLPAGRPIGDEGEGLSSGERRRVAMARALLRIRSGGARLLVADEPTAGLDQQREAELLQAVRASGASALIVSHRPAVLALADRVVTLQAPAAEGTDLAEVVR